MRPKAIFISHGGGPLPLLGDNEHEQMVDCLRDIAGSFERPAAILVISAHWEAEQPTVTASAAPELLYDYYGFPPESYQIRYPSPGDPALARDIGHCLEQAGLDVSMEGQRGLDHGVFVPLAIMYPEADIPCVQLSLLNSLDPAQHLQLGKALRALNRERVLIVGSGFSFHNMKAFFRHDDPAAEQHNLAFEQWLGEVCGDKSLSEAEREQALLAWGEAPGARFCHPREEHLLPLHVCYGVAGSAYRQRHQIRILKRAASMIIW